MAERRHILFYEYVGDIVERRAPFRDAHLGEIRAGKDDGRILMAGPLGDPPHGAAIVFVDAANAEVFAERDPYVTGGLVTNWCVEPWTLV
ncbi:MAG: hypothetical protein JO286_00080 [Solirubrobacterales bacterium]|nr:hypothetical protein [Solirubrobacterales bacterium]MBV9805540.1 hypothetical protein [Solirubrobacterales bacterium]